MRKLRQALAITVAFVALSAAPAYAHTCSHSTALKQIGTSSTYSSWYRDTQPNNGHYSQLWNCGSGGCIRTYVHGHIPATSACPGHYYVPGGPGA